MNANEAFETLLDAVEATKYGLKNDRSAYRPDDELGWYNLYERLYNSTISANGYTITLEEDFGGEGMGDNRYLVIKFSSPDGDFYFRKDAYYASYDGTTWDGYFYAVTPKQKTITVFERV